MKTKEVTVPKELSTDYQRIVEFIVKQSGNPALRAIAPGEKLTQEEAESLVAALKKFLEDNYPKVSLEPVGEVQVTTTKITTLTQEELKRKFEEAENAKPVQFSFTIPIPSSAQPAFELIAKLEEVIKILELAIEKSAKGKER